MNIVDREYDILLTNLLNKLKYHGKMRSDRTNTGTVSLFGPQLDLNVSKCFPIISTKTVFWRGVYEELFWFLQGKTNSKELEEKGINIWKEWGNAEREHGPIYGAMWRKFPSPEPMLPADQIVDAERLIKEQPTSRRIIVSAWHPSLVAKQSLPPCHTLFQFYVDDDTLSLKLYMRSCDVFLGLPFNIASYGLLLYLMAKRTNLKPYRLIITFGDLHLYLNHIDQAVEQQSRLHNKYPIPTLTVHDSVYGKAWEDINAEDFTLHDYKPLGKISAPVAV